MGLLDRLRAWLGLDDDASEAEASEAEDAAEESPRLDPSNVTEVRTESEDDPVEKLRELDGDEPPAEDGEG
jgi:hypothetical protein